MSFLDHKTGIAQTCAKERDSFFNTDSDRLFWPCGCGIEFEHDIRVRQSEFCSHLFDPFLMRLWQALQHRAERELVDTLQIQTFFGHTFGQKEINAERLVGFGLDLSNCRMKLIHCETAAA